MRPLVPEDLRHNGNARRDAAVASLVRAALATAHGARDRTTSASDYARARWGNDRTAELILRAPVSPTTIASAPALAQVAAAFLDVLVPLSAGADLLARGVKLNFDGAAQLNIPAITLPNVTFVGEGAPVPVLQPTTSTPAALVPHKLMSIIVLTNEVMHSPNAEELTKQALVEAVGPGLDAILFDTNAATATRPAGLRAGIAGLTPAASASAKDQIIVDDLQALTLAVAPVSGNNSAVIIASPDAAVALRLRVLREDVPILTSSSLAARTVIMCVPSAIVSAIEGAPVIDASNVSEVHRETVPADIVGSPGTVAVPVTSIFQTDETGLRLRWPISWALRDSRGLAWMTNVNW